MDSRVENGKNQVYKSKFCTEQENRAAEHKKAPNRGKKGNGSL